jgi:hypothetical protein
MVHHRSPFLESPRAAELSDIEPIELANGQEARESEHIFSFGSKKPKNKKRVESLRKTGYI